MFRGAAYGPLGRPRQEPPAAGRLGTLAPNLVLAAALPKWYGVCSQAPGKGLLTDQYRSSQPHDAAGLASGS